MFPTCVDCVLKTLELQLADPCLTLPRKHPIQNLQMELRFLKCYFWCFSTLAGADLNFPMNNVWAGIDFSLSINYKRYYTHFDSAVSTALAKVQLYKPKIRKSCIAFLERSSVLIQPRKIYDMVEFLDCIIENLEYLVSSKYNMNLRVKEQMGMGSSEEKLRLLRSLLVLAEIRCSRHEILIDHLLVHNQAWINSIACQSLLLWIDPMDQNNQKVIEMHLQHTYSSVTAKVVGSYIDIFLRILPASIRDYNYREILDEGLIFLIALVMESPKKGVLIPTGVSVDEVRFLMHSFLSGRRKEHIAKDRDVFPDYVEEFLLEINKVKAKAREFYTQDIHKLRWFRSPLTNGIGFIDSLLEKLKETLEGKAKVLSFGRHQVGVIQEELKSVRPDLDNILELKNDSEELSALWTQIVNVAYRAEHVIDSCLIGDGQISYHVICLSDIIEEIKLIKNEFRKIRRKEVYIRKISGNKDSSRTLPARANTSKLDEIVVGFKDVAETIMDKLRGGSARRDIVTIVGMAGQGKTTLAKTIYNDPLIQYDFHISAWCCISQVYKKRKLLLDILSHIVTRDTIITMSDEDLGERLWKCLKGHKYLIVIDDIWDSKAWYDIERFFPDDNNGSRIMFTSRIHDVALQVKANSKPHHLRPLSNDESWELLEKKLLEKGDCPSHLSEVGEHIVKLCKALPLAIVVIAGSRLASEGYMDILELSYMHLPDHLKTCFLYFGALPEDKVISAQKLIKLWIAEGFVRRTGIKRLEDVAKEYFMDLVRRSLVIVTGRSSTGGIKTCYIHDLFRDLCLAKAKEEYFFQLVSISGGHDLPHFLLNPVNYDQYRLMVYGDWDHFVKSRPHGLRIHSLLFFAANSLNLFPCSNASISFDRFKHLKVGMFKNVPSSIVNLKTLETLVIKSVTSIVFPAIIWKMKSLRNVDVKTDFVFAEDYDSFDSLSNLEVLSTIRISHPQVTMKLFGRLPALRKLSCIFVKSQSGVSCPFEYRSLFDSLRRLESLKIIQWEASCLEFDQFRAFGIPRTLKKLTLSRLGLPWWAISAIGQLSNLEGVDRKYHNKSQFDDYQERVQIAGNQGHSWNEEMQDLFARVSTTIVPVRVPAAIPTPTTSAPSIWFIYGGDAETNDDNHGAKSAKDGGSYYAKSAKDGLRNTGHKESDRSIGHQNEPFGVPEPREAAISTGVESEERERNDPKEWERGSRV
ncbi:putative late blight resistance protein homolog R1B-17 [Coffea arabica]|uniref:Late blight resistance protein homolog R1B-17 n=1 Tax=Coffea arabica TaxID=13443 RepID=A0A6P6T224_COFAR